MSEGIKYVPLTFVTAATEKEKLIRNTILLRHFMSEAEGSTTLSDYIDGTQYGFNAPASETGTNKYVRISDISNGEIAWDAVPFCKCDDPETYLLKKDDIVVARTGGTTGKSYMVSLPPTGAMSISKTFTLRTSAPVIMRRISASFASAFERSGKDGLGRSSRKKSPFNRLPHIEESSRATT